MKKDLQSFSYRNYFRATPQNLQYLTEGIQGLLVTVASTNIITGDAKVSFYLMIATYVTGKVSKFFGRIEHDQEEIRIKVPGSVANDIEITTQPADADDSKPV